MQEAGRGLLCSWHPEESTCSPRCLQIVALGAQLPLTFTLWSIIKERGKTFFEKYIKKYLKLCAWGKPSEAIAVGDVTSWARVKCLCELVAALHRNLL